MAEQDKVFSRLNEIHKDLSEKIEHISEQITREKAQCEICRPIVLGNGHDPVDIRLDRLEQASASWSKFRYAVFTGAGSLIAVIVGWLPKLLKW